VTVDHRSWTRHGSPEVALVLGGGQALGAYLARAYEEMHTRGLRPGWVIGSSIGAVTGAIIAGNPPGRRLERLRLFWDMASQPSVWSPPSGAGGLRELYNAAHVAAAMVLGRPGLFRPRHLGPWSALPWPPGAISLHDHAPLRGTLERLIDFDLLNRAEPRLSVACADLETGEEVWFDSARERIVPEHLLASGAQAPSFPPVEIGGRLLCDPGYVNNLPLDRALADPPLERDLLCFAVELFNLRGRRPRSLDGAMERAQDMLFAGHARLHVAALRREYDLRGRLEPDGAAVTLVHLAYRAPGHEVAAKMFDYSPASVSDRWAAGGRDMARAFGLLARAPERDGRFAYLPVEPGHDAPGADGASRLGSAEDAEGHLPRGEGP
jgi:NTE family protein